MRGVAWKAAKEVVVMFRRDREGTGWRGMSDCEIALIRVEQRDGILRSVDVNRIAEIVVAEEGSLGR